MPSSHDTTTTGSPYAGENWHYWPRDEDGNPTPPEEHDDDSHEQSVSPQSTQAGTSREQYVATGWLKDTAELHCPIAMHEPPYAPSVSAALADHDVDDGRILDAHEVCELTAWLFGGDPGAVGERDRRALHREHEAIELTEPRAFAPMAPDGSAEGQDHDTHRAFRVNEEHGYLPSGPVIANRPAEAFFGLVYGYLLHAVESARTALQCSTAEAIYDLAASLKRRPDGPHDVTIMAEVVRLAEDPTALHGAEHR